MPRAIDEHQDGGENSHCKKSFEFAAEVIWLSSPRIAKFGLLSTQAIQARVLFTVDRR
ncbi:hypothetical protein [Rhizobium paranaense]|uniref:Uncharacterized protein n=1 Tax=Rhizobium paranaense TaxID=1650438 RepID=A0A7W8XWU6_9HYPH|nr:hypothetical protein [Rhizobium paranaense]MBB5577001.1 hypothetical protein [Rhizobium paranaense]